MEKIVLTGGIATGKSTVGKYLMEKGIPVIDTDVVSRQVVEPKTPGLARLVGHFGESILREDGQLDREELGNIVFNDDQEREILNEILHPLIAEEVDRQLDYYQTENVPRVVLDVPLFFESNMSLAYNRVWLVYTKPSIQLERLQARNNYTKEEAMSRINSQIPINKKVGMADRVIDNTYDLENTYRQVDLALNS